MIASVVATLDSDCAQREQLLRDVASRPGVDLGDCAPDARRIPLTIESGNRHTLEETTEWLRTREGVLGVDVVLVYLDDEATTASTRGESDE